MTVLTIRSFPGKIRGRAPVGAAAADLSMQAQARAIADGASVLVETCHEWIAGFLTRPGSRR